jgi:capsular exopolysaccharide synthesis family protein
VWLVLAVGVPLGVGGAVLVVKMPAVYRATAQIQIEPPEYDQVLETLVSHNSGHRDPNAAETYVANKLALLRSKTLAEQVVTSPDFAQPLTPGGDPAQELLDCLQTRQVPGSSHFIVTLEGTDPARTAKMLYALLEKLRDQTREEIERMNDRSKANAVEHLGRLEREMQALNKRMELTLKGSAVIGPGGKNLLEEQWQLAGLSLTQKQAKLGDMRQQAWLAQVLPGGRDNPELSVRQSMLAELEKQRRTLSRSLRQYQRTMRHFDTDNATRIQAGKLEDVMDEIERLRSEPVAKAESPGTELFESMIRSLSEEIRTDHEAHKSLLLKFQESSPEHQRFLNDMDERKEKAERISQLLTKVSDFDILSKSQKPAVVIPEAVAEPTIPVRPKRALMVVLGLILSLGLGVGLVCVLEHFDHSVKVPEHLTAGLTLPLFGVIPRIRRTALTHRGGHLWTPGAPDSVEADAYRNLRASLLGATDRVGPIVTLLVTSAKAGEGKSTTALNLAATCARAGERTLLMDVDLRRPSLTEVFEGDGHEVGLVDALRGELPWQQALVRSDLPNLDFLPTGDTRDIPVEILGTLELRQLLIAVSGHYDRVILDGPAVLGLADCRMLGRLVDAAVLVVRSGSNGLPPLVRAKSMLEQSHVPIAGVVFNGLYEDLHNWSSYGPYEAYGSGAARASAGRRLAAPEEPTALPAGSYQS